MELEKINEKIKKIVDEALAKKNKIADDLSKANEELNNIDNLLHQALLDCDIEKHNKLLQEKKEIEDRIKFYNDFIDNFNELPLITEDIASDLLKDIDKSINEHLNKDYDEFCFNLNNLYKFANDKIKFYKDGKDLAYKLMNYAKLNLALPEYNKTYIFNDVENVIYPIKKRRNI